MVVPIHNKKPHVARALSSVYAQSCQDFEVLIIDDASTDGSLEVVSRFEDARIRVLQRSTPGPGGYAARNLGICEARGTWIAFLDADDSWREEHLASVRRLADQFPEENFLGCGWIIKDEDGEREDPYYRLMREKGSHRVPLRSYLEHSLAGCRPVHTTISCVKKNDFVCSGLFPEEKKAKRGGDLHAWISLMCRFRSMAWSSHVGGIYYEDSVNMVTKTAPSSTHLLERDVYRELSSGLDRGEKLLLRRYFNRRLKTSWVGNFNRRAKNFYLPGKLYWRGDVVNSLRFSARTIVPRPVVMLMKHLRGRRSLKD